MAYFTIEALESGRLDVYAVGAAVTLYYRYPEGSWDSANISAGGAFTIPSVSAGSIYEFKSTRTGMSTSKYIRILPRYKCKLSGNILSLMYGDNYEDHLTDTLPDYGCYMMFYQANVIDASELVIPNPSIGQDGLAAMFWQSALEKPPVLPATTVGSGGYHSLFRECVNLKYCPALPATTLNGTGVYGQMFSGCTSLTSCPDIPYMTLFWPEMFYRMFYGCTGIKYPSNIYITWYSNYCCQQMFEGTSIKLNTDGKGVPYRIPASGTGRVSTGSLTRMFPNLTPTVNTQYWYELQIDGPVIKYNGEYYSGEQIMDCNAVIQNALLSEEIIADTLNFTLRSSVDLTGYQYGSEVQYYYDDVLVGVFYLKNVTRTAKEEYTFECISKIGLLANVTHMGDIYSNATVQSVITDIMTTAGWTSGYSIGSDISALTVTGWLPVDTCLNQLQQVLFAIGACVYKDSTGNVEFRFPTTTSQGTLDSGKIYTNGSIDYLAPATDVNISEHSYYNLSTDEEVQLFDNTEDLYDGSSRVVVFDEPCHDLRVDETATIHTLVIEDYGVNWAQVSGQGILLGKKYTHNIAITSETGSTGQSKVIEVTDATLVSNLNSSAVAKRIKNYYTTAKEVGYGLVWDGEKTGYKYQFENPFEETETGYLKEMQMTASAILKADTTWATGYEIGPLGNDYNAYVIIDSTDGLSGTWAVPSDMQGKTVRVVMFSGAQGGTGGAKGNDGGSGGGSGGNAITMGVGWLAYYNTGGDGGSGGTGGSKGAGGTGPATFAEFKTTLSDASYAYTLGAGGTGGAINSGVGSYGGDSTFMSHTSNEKARPSGSYQNIVDGSIYCENGEEGIADGGNGGNGGSGATYTTQSATNGTNGTGTATAGTGGTYLITQLSGGYSFWFNSGGGGGGGSCYQDAGSNGENGQGVTEWWDPSITYAWHASKGGNGGAGASSTYIPAQTTLGKGGQGGEGGAGGGGGGLSFWGNNSYGSVSNASGGTGGNGGVGGQGSDGFIIVYYNTAA